MLLGGEHSEAAHRPGLSGSPDFALFPPAAGFPADSTNREGFQPLGPRIRALLIWPKVPPSFWNPQRTPGLKERSQIPPLGLLTIAALCPKNWTIRFIDQMVENLLDEDIRDADLVMVSGMQVQRQAIQEILVRARALGKRTIIGGPYASSEPESVLPLADHVVVGEPDAEFPRIAAELENGSARRLYHIAEKPDVTGTPVPRFDLLKLEHYACMAVQFSRGCPFQCEFCDIITIYGRKPRTKHPAQVIAELQTLLELGARKPVFIVDDNFIGNHKRALELAEELRKWSGAHGHPFPFHTEASIDLAQRPALIDAMVKANFFGVFVGIESPSRESLIEAKKLQNLRCDPIESIQVLQDKGLWVTGGFIIGFDSDSEDIFECQRDFIERAAIPWAMLGFLQAPPTTPLYQRMLKEGRLLDGGMVSNFHPPNFRTLLPLPVLLRGVRETLQSLYAPSAFYDRCLRSLIAWKPQGQKPPAIPFLPTLRALLSLLWCQGIRSDYRRQWWKFLFELLRRWSDVPLKRWWACTLLVSGHHFIRYARAVAEQLEGELRKLGTEGTGGIEGHGGSQAGTEAARVIFAPAVHNSRASNLPSAGSG